MRVRFSTYRVISLFVFSLALSVAIAACGAGSSGGSSSSGASPTQTAAPVKPTKVPTIDAAFCAHIMTLIEANQMTGFSATNIRVQQTSDNNGGSCNYESKPYYATVFLAFFPSGGGASALQAVGSQITQANPAAKVTTISGLGDQAIAIVNPIQGIVTQYHVMVIYGAVMIDVVNPGKNVPSGGDSAAIAALTNIARQAISRV